MISTCAVTVIVPFFNARKTLGECLASISAQREPNFEAILIDDGSNDGSNQLAESYAANNQHFHLLRQDNSGVSAARNAGLKQACGEFIVFVDADDILMPGALKTMIDLIDSGVDLLIASHESFRRVGSFKVKGKKTIFDELRFPLDGRVVIDSIDSALSTPWAKMYRASVIKNNSLCFDVGMPIGEDTRFNLGFCQHASGSIKTIGAEIYGYALGGTASTKRFYSEIMAHYMELFTAYESSGLLFSSEYITELYERFLKASLFHLYSHCPDREARRRALADLPPFIGLMPSFFSSCDKAGFVDCFTKDELTTFLRDWEMRNRGAISVNRLKQRIRGSVCR